MANFFAFSIFLLSNFNIIYLSKFFILRFKYFKITINKIIENGLNKYIKDKKVNHIGKRLRILVTIYLERNLKLHKNKFDALRLEVSLE
jgi:hypothetical protein